GIAATGFAARRKRSWRAGSGNAEQPRHLSVLIHLKRPHTPHVHPVSSLHTRQANERGVAARSAYHRPNSTRVRHECSDRIGSSPPSGRGDGARHFKGKHLTQDPSGNVAVQPVLHHHPPPVGPKRSVLTIVGAYPSATRVVAAVSTNWVGPQM